MRRRQYLTGAATVTVSTVAGCTVLADESSLGMPEEEQDRGTVRMIYAKDNEDVLRVNHMVDRPNEQDVFRLRTLFVQPQNTELDEFTLRITPRGLFDFGFDVYIKPPRDAQFGNHVTYRSDDETVLEVSDTGEGGGGTVVVEALIQPASGDLSELPEARVEHEAVLLESGFFADEFIADHYAHLDLPALTETLV